MNMNEILIGLVIGVLATLIGAFIISKTTERKRKKIKLKIDELNFEKKFLNKLKTGNIFLLRSSLRTLCTCLGILFCTIGAIILSYTIELPNFIKYNIKAIGSAVIIACGMILIKHASLILKLENLPAAIKKIEDKRDKLGSKIN